ncbi:acyltransferase family protein [Mangrovimonas futianensis]|uniref:acyltransferase family protein n=1 Tax=Mangrovimonas futianensis TaxID=2895523 RepID=UPI001E55D03A|nr:acyltransferase [Mangrovimonas futianensis]MCF1422423.1 acyltransferase [Mangrovimonas futianensis]
MDYSKRIFGLDLMRALAILLVVVAHLLWIFPNNNGLIGDLMRLGGVLGVEMFFVLSGFLIGRIVYKLYKNADFSFNDLFYFWIRRWFRTLPNYYLALIINIGVVIYLGRSLPNKLWYYFIFIQNLAWEMPLFFTESWSLPIEEFAYILGPFLMYAVLLFKIGFDRTKWFAIITVFILSFFLVTKIWFNQFEAISDMNFWNTNLKSVVIYRMDAIYYGVLGALMSKIYSEQWYRYRFHLAGVGILIFLSINALIPFAHFYIDKEPFFWNVLYLPINSIILSFMLPLLSSLNTAPKFIRNPITFLSVTSYSIYLLHYSIILQLMKYFIPTDELSTFDLVIYSIVYLNITFFCAFFLYKFFEKPFMDLRDKIYFKKFFNQFSN